VSERLKLGAAIAAFGMLAGSAAFAQDAAAPVNPACGEPKLSKKLAKPMDAAQKAREARNWTEMLAKVNEADAVAIEKTEYDKFWITELRGFAEANLKQYPDAVRNLGAAYNSPCMNDADKPQRAKLLMQLSYQDKNYDKAIEYGNLAWKPGGDTDVGIYLGNAYYVKDSYADARRVIGDVVKTLEDGGKTPDEQTYRILQSACLALKDDACVTDLIEKLVINYPKQTYWEHLVDSLLRGSKNDRHLLNVLRLADGANAMTDPTHYVEMAQLAMAQGLPGEAQATLEKGFQKGVFAAAREKDHATRLLADAKQATALDKSTLANQDASAKAKPTGDADSKLGAAYLSYGDNAKAIESLQRAIGKGGIKNPDEAGVLLGIAYLRSGNKAEADKAFATVTQDPTMKRIAKLWVLSSGSRAAGTAGT